MKYTIPLVLTIALLIGCGPEKIEEVDKNEPVDNFVIHTVDKVNMPFIVKHTGTHCSPCGTWGWDMFEEFTTQFKDEAVFMASYAYGKNYIIDEVTDYSTYCDIKGFPTFTVNNESMLSDARANQSVNVQQEKDLTVAHATKFINGDVLANTAVIYKIEGDDLIIKYKTQAFSDLNGADLRTAIYVNENKVVGHQSGYPTPSLASHKHVMRASMDGKLWGRTVGALGTNEVNEGDAVIPISSEWNRDNLEVIAVIYNKTGSEYKVVNASVGALISE